MKARRKRPFFDGTYWEYCIRTAPDCFHIFPNGTVDVDFDLLNEKKAVFFQKGTGPEWRAEHTSVEAVSVILENVLPCDIWAKYTVRLEDAELERLRTCRLVLEEAPDKFDSFDKYPYYQLRGKPVTENQAFEMIQGTSGSNHFSNYWLEHRHPYPYGWVHPVGLIGINSNMHKYPTFPELMDDLLRFQRDFPFLDFAAAIAWEADNPRYEDLGSTPREDELYKKQQRFLDNVWYGIRLDGSTIEFLGKERAVETYQKYEALYGDSDFGIYVPELCWSKEISRGLDIEAYLRRCTAALDLEKT